MRQNCRITICRLSNSPHPVLFSRYKEQRKNEFRGRDGHANKFGDLLKNGETSDLLLTALIPMKLVGSINFPRD